MNETREHEIHKTFSCVLLYREIEPNSTLNNYILFLFFLSFRSSSATCSEHSEVSNTLQSSLLTSFCLATCFVRPSVCLSVFLSFYFMFCVLFLSSNAEKRFSVNRSRSVRLVTQAETDHF